MGAETQEASIEDGGSLLADQLIKMMKDTGIPNGLQGVGYGREDLEDLTERSYAQKRLIDNAPCPVSREQMKGLFEDSLSYW